MKLCVLGGGGVRSPFLAKSIACNSKLANITEVVFMDIDSYKLEKYGELARQISLRINPELNIQLETDAYKALDKADYVITTLRVGGDQARVNDEKIVSKYGIIAQETTGACGFAMAMRSIPRLIEYCKIIKEVSNPDCMIFNFTNPSGIVTQALNDLGYKVFGICDAPSEFIKQISQMLNVGERKFTSNCFGLNHYSWFNHFEIDNVDVTKQVLDSSELFEKTEMRLFEKDILNMTDGFLLNEYFYFYFYNKKAIELTLKSDQTRAQLIEMVNLQMNEALKNIDVKSNFETAFQLFFDHYYIRENNYMKTESGKNRVQHYSTPTVSEFIQTADDGGYAGVALRCVKALATNEPIEMILSVPNRGAISELFDDDIVEISCIIDSSGVHPKKQTDIPIVISNMICSMKEYERIAVKAIVNKDRNLAVKALLVNPLVANYDIAKNIIDEFIEQYEGELGTWK